MVEWIRRTYQNEDKVLTQLDFEYELWAHFGPSNCESFDENLPQIQHLGPFCDYQREFEQLSNRIRGWTQKALVETFEGGLKPKNFDAIHMFKPLSLKVGHWISPYA